MDVRNGYYKDDYKSKSRSHLTNNRRLRIYSANFRPSEQLMDIRMLSQIIYITTQFDLLTNDLI